MEKKYQPQFKDLPKFKSKIALDKWLKENTYKKIHLKEMGFDLMTIYVHQSGEILQTDAHGSIYIGKFINMANLNTSAKIEIWDGEKFERYGKLIIEKLTKF